MSATTTIITGATSGIGKQTALALANKGHAVYLLVRDVVKCDNFIRELKQLTGNKEIYCIKCDLSDLHSVYTAAEKLKSRLLSINILINNAGGMFPERKLSKDGFELTFATNHLGHFALTIYLMPLLQKGQARIINVSSEAHKFGKADFSDINSEKSYRPMRVYGQAKLYNIYFTKSLAEKYGSKGITAFALHPGVVNTGFGAGAGGLTGFFLTIARPFMITPEKGAQTTIYLATQTGLHTQNGMYFKKKKPVSPSSAANDATAREKLWQISETILEAHPQGV